MSLDSNTQLLVENALADMMLKIEDIGWQKLSGFDMGDDEELSKDTLDEVSAALRAMLVINPLVKRGINMRAQYVHGKGVEFHGIEDTHEVFKDRKNKQYLFSDEARAENERCLATDGNFFVLATGTLNGRKTRHRKNGTNGSAAIQRIPTSQIKGIVTNPDDSEDVWFYRREWVRKTTTSSGKPKVENKVEYIPSDLYDTSNGKPMRLNDKPVNWSGVLIDMKVNRQVGWRWGTPDGMSVVFWAKAHKEFLEDQAKLVKALSRFAFKATAPTPGAVQNVAAKVAQPANSSYKEDVGQTAVMTAGANLQPLGRTSGSVDFSAGLPLASYVAAGLEIPLTDLISDSSLSNRSAAETLSESKLAAMQARQNAWKEFYSRLFDYWGMEGVETTFPDIEDENRLRAIQAIQAATSMNVLSAEEVRKQVLYILGIETDEEMPDEEALGNLILSMIKEQEAAEKQAQTDAEVAADKMNDPSYSQNSTRDAIGQHEYTDGQDGQ